MGSEYDADRDFAIAIYLELMAHAIKEDVLDNNGCWLMASNAIGAVEIFNQSWKDKKTKENDT